VVGDCSDSMGNGRLVTVFTNNLQRSRDAV
jgi:hypothetical protein